MNPEPLQPRDKWPRELDDTLIKYFSKSRLIGNFINQEEFDAILFSMFTSFKRYRHYKGGTFKFEKFDTDIAKNILWPKLKKILPWLSNKDILDGNGYITATNYALHMDSCNPSVYFNSNQLSVKSFILPLFTCKPDNKKESQFVLMENRLLGWECNFSNTKSNVNMTYQKNVESYENLPWLDCNGKKLNLDSNKFYISDDIYNNHLSHIPKETYHSMKIENIFNFTEKSIIIFDPYQAHVTGNKNWSNTNLKGGIRFNINKKVDAL